MTQPDWTNHPLVVRLLSVHALLRRDIRTVRALAADLASGHRSGRSVMAVVDALAVADPAFTLRTRCLQMCEFLHSHHGLEDEIFPQLAAAEPTLGPVVDRLVAEHQQVSVMLARIRGLLGSAPTALDAVSLALTQLADHVHVHLDYEEAHIGPALARLT